MNGREHSQATLELTKKVTDVRLPRKISDAAQAATRRAQKLREALSANNRSDVVQALHTRLDTRGFLVSDNFANMGLPLGEQMDTSTLDPARIVADESGQQYLKFLLNPEEGKVLERHASISSGDMTEIVVIKRNEGGDWSAERYEHCQPQGLTCTDSNMPVSQWAVATLRAKTEAPVLFRLAGPYSAHDDRTATASLLNQMMASARAARHTPANV